MPEEASPPRKPSPKPQNIAFVFGYPERVGENVANAAVLIVPPRRDPAQLPKIPPLRRSGPRHVQTRRRSEFPTATLQGLENRPADLLRHRIPRACPPPGTRGGGYHPHLNGADGALLCRSRRHVIPARAYENQVFLAYANHSGTDDGLDYIGLSSICGPDGKNPRRRRQGRRILIDATIDQAPPRRRPQSRPPAHRPAAGPLWAAGRVAILSLRR